MMAIIWVSRDVYVIVALLFVSLIAGITGFTIEFISEQDGIFCLLAVLFLPVVMVYGVIRAINEIFCETAGELCSDFGRMFCGGV